LKIAAVSDLGGLGAKEGSPVTYNWTLSNPLPVLLPWLGILCLLLLKPNRCAQAWWIWVPLAALAGLAAALHSGEDFMPGALRGAIADWLTTGSFGLAAVWLVAGYLGWKHRALAWLGTLVTLTGVSLLSFAVRQAIEGLAPETVPTGIFLCAGGLVMSVALTLAGLVCRGRYAPLRLCLWLLAALLVVWLLVIGPFFLAAMIFSNGQVQVTALVEAVLSATGITFGLLLPFLLLSFVNEFYRRRLKELLHLGGEQTPPVIERPLTSPALVAGS
jgi:hypothetical protein